MTDKRTPAQVAADDNRLIANATAAALARQAANDQAALDARLSAYWARA